MEETIREELKSLVISVNESLQYYEKDFISVQRCPVIPRERVESFRQYIECRFNYEAFKSPTLRPYAEYFDGYLFDVVAVYDEDEKKRIFSEVCVELCTNPQSFLDDQYNDDPDISFLSVIDEVKEILGGSRIYFNKSKRIPKIRVE